MAYHNEVTCQI